MKRKGLALVGGMLLLSLTGFAQAFQKAPELTFENALPVDGMSQGNLSGLARCEGALQAISDRQDDHLYVLTRSDSSWRAEVRRFDLPPRPSSMLPYHLQFGSWLRGLRGRALDFEGISCDASGARYLVSEGLLAILRLPPVADGEAAQGEWLDIDEKLYSEGAEQGLWQQINALAEGIAVSPDGETLWLAAERQGRGLLKLQRQNGHWRCPVAGCVLLAERRYMPAAPFGPGILDAGLMPLDFTALSYWGDRLWTLERNEHQVCRRHPVSAVRERCWSFADTVLSEPYLYPDAPFGLAEALLVDEQGILVGLDNNNRTRPDGDARPWIFQFSLPADWQEDNGSE